MQRLQVPLILIMASVAGLFAMARPIEAGGGGHGGCSQKPTEAASDAVAIANNCFGPAILYVEAGTTVIWTNEDESQHNVTFLDGSRAGDDPDLFYRDAVQATFGSPGLFAYYCSVHPAMLGVVAVGDPTEFAVLQAPVVEPDPSPPSATETTASTSTAAIAGLVLAVGIVSAGSGFFLRRRVRSS